MANIASIEKRLARLNKWLARREYLREKLITEIAPIRKELRQVNKNIVGARKALKDTIGK